MGEWGQGQAIGWYTAPVPMQWFGPAGPWRGAVTWASAVCLGAVSFGASPAVALDLRQEMQGLVAEFRAEQAGADAALCRQFSDEALELLSSRLGAVAAEASAEASLLATEMAAVLETRVSSGKPAWNQGQNASTASEILALAEECKGRIKELDARSRAELQTALADLAKTYVARRNREALARVQAYLGRLRGILQTAMEESKAQAREKAEQTAATVRTNAQENQARAREKAEEAAAGFKAKAQESQAQLRQKMAEALAEFKAKLAASLEARRQRPARSWPPAGRRLPGK